MNIYNIGSMLCELRKKKKFSQKQLAEGICSVTYISKIENGKKIPSHDITVKLFSRLGVNPSLFDTSLSSTDNERYSEHCFELERLIGASSFLEAEQYLDFLENNFTFYASGEPRQYIMGKRSHILTNLYKKFDEAYQMAYQSIFLTKSDFTLETRDQYEYYSINELWAMLYMAAAFYWKENDHPAGNGYDLPITLSSFVLSHLNKGYLHPSMIGILYASAVFYLSKSLTSAGRCDETSVMLDNGLHYLTRQYNQILELLGKLLINRSLCTLPKQERNALLENKIKAPAAFAAAERTQEEKFLFEVGRALLSLAGNPVTIGRYLGDEIADENE